MKVDLMRRSLLGAAVASAATAANLPLVGQAAASQSGLSPAWPLKTVRAGPLDISYAELGATNETVAILLHGWPYDIHSFVQVGPALARQGYRVLIPYLRGFGGTSFISTHALRNGQPAAVAGDTIAMMDALGISRAILGGFDWGARSSDIIAALWPERCTGLVSVSGYLIGSQAAGRLPLPPEAELQWWYQFYFATQRGRDGYARYRRDFARLIWRLASPRWSFDEETFDRSAAALENPDHVAVVIHNYRWRQGLVEGERRYDAQEARLAASPPITVPTITLEGDANGAPHPDAAVYASKFTGPYMHRIISGGIGHNLPQEAPDAFVKAVLDLPVVR